VAAGMTPVDGLELTHAAIVGADRENRTLRPCLPHTQLMINEKVNSMASTKEVSAAQDLGAIARKWWAAIEAGDSTTLGDMVTDDMTWEIMHVGHLMPGGGIYRGRTEINHLIMLIPTGFYIPGQTKMNITNIYIADPVVIAEVSIDAVTATGRSMQDAKYISLITVDDGKITYVREYPDALKAKAAHLD
jgi:ketosteroid isomerase-like protein